MALRVSWSPRALADVEAIAIYIASDSPAYAQAVLKKIINSTGNLAHFPASGRIVPEFQDPNIRELIVYSYRVIYSVSKSEVLIATVIHGKRNLS